MNLRSRFIGLLLSTLIGFAMEARSQEVLVHLNAVRVSEAETRAILAPYGEVLGWVERRRAWRFRPHNPASVAGVRRLREVRAVTVPGPGGVMLHDMNSLRTIDERIEQLLSEPPLESEREEERPGAPRDRSPRLDYLESLRWYVRLRAYPFDTIDWNAVGRAIERRESMPVAIPAADPGTQSAHQWRFVGPRGLDVPYRIYFGVPPLTGRVNAIAYDPANPSTVYLAAPLGGLWRSRDAGETWTSLGDRWPAMAASAIAIPRQSPNSLYVGTGDFHGFNGRPRGIMKSTDAGATWQEIGTGQFGDVSISSIAIDPDNPNRLTVATGRGPASWGRVWQTTDGGTTWRAVIRTGALWAKVAASPIDPNRMMAVGGGYNGGEIWRSADGGNSWTKISMPSSNGFHWSFDVVYSTVSPNRVYLMIPTDGRIFRSEDNGGSWIDVTNDHPGGYNWSQGWYDWHLSVARHPQTPAGEILFSGLIDIAISVDAGASWASIGGPTYSNQALTHNDQHSFAAHPGDPNQFLIGNDGGIFRGVFDPFSRRASLTPLNQDIGITQFYTLDVHPANDSILLGGTQDNATPFFDRDPDRWKNVGGGDGGGVAINPIDPRNMYATAQNYGYDGTRIWIYRTDDGWRSASYPGVAIGSGDSVAFIPPMAINPTQPRYLYLGSQYAHRYDRQTNSWTVRLGGTRLVKNNGVVSAIAVAPSDPTTIAMGSSDGAVHVSRDGGTSWRLIHTGSPGLPDRAVTSLSFHPTEPRDLLVTVSGTGTGHVWRLADVDAPTRRWIDVSGSGTGRLPDISVNSVVRHAASPGRVWYAGADVGAYGTVDGGITWFNMTNPLGLPNTQVNALRFNPRTSTLTAATFGRGVWQLKAPIRAVPRPAGNSARQ